MQLHAKQTRNSRYRWSHSAEKIDGGFILLDMGAFQACWKAHRSGDLRLVDIRVWLAVVEILEQRRLAKSRKRPLFRLEELATLIGSASLRTVRSSVRRLERACLLTWNERNLRLHRGDVMRTGRPYVPVPRRLLKWLANSGSKSDIATAIATCDSCLFFWSKEKRVESGGYSKSGEVSARYGISERSVKRSRTKLKKIGWLAAVSDGRAGGRTGARFTADVTWQRSDLSPQRNRNYTVLSPPKEDQITPFGRKYQEPPAADRGAKLRSAPDLRRVIVNDLKSPARVNRLYEQCVRARLIKPSEAGRLKVFAAAERALRCGTTNPAGLFVAVIRKRLWHHISQRDEDRGRDAMRRSLGPTSRRRTSNRPSNPPMTCRRSVRDLIAASLQSAAGSEKPDTQIASTRRKNEQQLVSFSHDEQRNTGPGHGSSAGCHDGRATRGLPTGGQIDPV